MAKDEKPIFVDLDRGIIGVFDGVDKHTGDKDLVFIRFYPFNTVVGDAKRYAQPVRESCIFTLRPKNRDLVGTPREIVIVYENNIDSLFKGVDERLTKRIAELERQLDDKMLEVASAQQRAEAAQAGTKKLVSEAQEITKQQRRPNFFGPLDGLGGGGSPPYPPGGDDFS